MKIKEFSMELGGETLTAQFTDLVDQANSSVIMKHGDTTVLATAVMSPHKREGQDWFPLTVDYEEKFYAAGEILGSRYMRREGRPSEEAILSGRVVDRTIRPLFNQAMRNEVQVTITVLSLGKYDPDVLAVNAASLALATSDIPWNGPVSCVRVNDVDGSLKVNSTYEDRKDAPLSMIVSGKDGKINMIETGANQVVEDKISEAFDFAITDIEKIQEFQKKVVSEIGKEKAVVEIDEVTEEAKKLFTENIESKMDEFVFSGAGKKGIGELRNEWLALLKESLPEENTSVASEYYESQVDELLHKEAIANEKRADGRKMNEVRDLYTQAGGVSPVLHGSGIFYRGGTHVLSVLTLGGPRDALFIDGMEAQTEKRFMHHYNFPPYSVGETGRMGGFNRRMIGHGALAEKALSYVIPEKEDFPYTIRIVSESMASNGSTSMASICGSTLALLDAGVPIKAPVAGIAMGLMMEGDNTYKILTDIQGPEDHHGDMDFKVAGTKDGVTAIQMDIKVGSIPVTVLKEALVQAREARLQILEKIQEAIPETRKDISSNAPKILTMKILEDQIGKVIGPGGKVINKIKDDTGVTEIQIEDDGTVFITGKEGSAEKAQQDIYDMTREYKAGEKFDGTVIKVFDFGALVKINEFTDGLVHVSELAPFRIANVSDVVKEGDVIPIVVKETDDRGKMRFSLKDADPEYAKRKGVEPSTAPPPPPRSGGHGRGPGGRSHSPRR
ncbi:polyribonucleotide nucleotidyltransferase [Patescibacteria group bacterium]